MDSKDLVARIEGELGSTAGREAAAPLHPPPRVADHELVRRIGEGSYGEVWLARSVTGQWRAVKVVARARFASDRPYEREFHGVIQFEPISRTHSGLVQVLHVGRDDAVGAFYYVMELADASEAGVSQAVISESVISKSAEAATTDSLNTAYSPRTLRSDLKSRGRLPVAEALTLGVELSGALGHIHRHGLVHRDVKPSNVIYVQGQPKLADLGLVTSASEARSFVGTEGFIPPEGPGSVKADLFALGRLLYEAVTGKDRCEFPQLPPDLDAWPNREEFLEFNEVVTQLCAPDPARRYANAAEVAGDLNLILAGRSVRRANGVERRLQRARQISVVALGVLAAAAGTVWFQQLRQRQTEARAAHERALRERAVSAEQESRRQLYTALFEQARATVRSGELGQRVRALDAVRRAAAITNTPELRREALAALALPDLRWERELPFDGEFTARDLDPAFARIALCRGDGPIDVRAVSDFALLATLPASTNRRCFNVTWSGDGRFLAAKRDYDALGSSADLEVWEMNDPPRRILLIHDARFNAWSFHPRRAELLTAVQAGLIINWDLERGTELARRAVEATPEFLKYSPDGTAVAAAYQRTDGWGVSIHSAADSAMRASQVFTSPIGTIQWHPQGRWLAVTDYSGAVRLMEPETGLIRELGRHRAEAVTAVFDPAGDYLITGGWERSFICWDLRATERAFVIELDSYIGRFRADGSTFALLTDSGVQLRAFERPSVFRELTVGPPSRLRHAAFSPDGRRLAASSGAGLTVWDLAGGGLGAFDGSAPETRAFWSANGTELFGNSSPGTETQRWRVQSGASASAPPTLERLALGRLAGFNSLCLASNRVAWTGARGSTVTGLEDGPPDDGQWVPTARGINCLSPDGRWLAIYAPNTPWLHVYRLPDLARVTVLTNPPRISGFSFSPSGRELAVVSRGHLEFRSTTTWERTREATNFVGIPYVGAIFQPDERALWLAANLRTAGLHDARTFEPLLPLPAGLFPMALSPDGRHLAVSADEQRMQVWDLALVRARLRELGLDWDNSGR